MEFTIHNTHAFMLMLMLYIYIYIHIYVYIKLLKKAQTQVHMTWLEFGLFSTIIAIIRACACWALFVVTLTNTIHLIYIYIYNCWKSPNSSHMYDHGFTDNTNRQAVCKSQKKSFKWFTNSRRIKLKTIKTHHNQSKRPVTILNALMNTPLLHRCSYTGDYNAETRFSCIWD